ncbi:MAG TPA: peptidylprolyl isomerase [Rubrivivax sp.]|nr:peptidylprolyl isomerase [Rubrivivax sp.]
MSASLAGGGAGGVPRAGVRRWLREPLLQFLLAGLALFAGYRALHPQSAEPALANRIVITQDDLRQMGLAWKAQGRPPMSAPQWASLIEAKVREEILFREALALGLDKDDAIVKRRMAQKMEFLAQDAAAAREPAQDELRQWLASHPERFTLPPRVSFRHVYFALDRPGTPAHAAAQAALRTLSAHPARAQKLGDPFMYQDEYAERTPDQMAKDFGPAFAQALFKLPAGGWRGPIESGYGWHVIELSSSTPGRVPAFEEIAPEVKADWIAEQGELARRRAYEAMRARYEIVLPDFGDSSAPKP